MGAVPITIVGMLSHGDGSSDSVTLVGLASLTGLSVGGGPISPTPPPEVGGGPIVPPPVGGGPPAGTIVKAPPPSGGWAG